MCVCVCVCVCAQFCKFLCDVTCSCEYPLNKLHGYIPNHRLSLCCNIPGVYCNRIDYACQTGRLGLQGRVTDRECLSVTGTQRGKLCILCVESSQSRDRTGSTCLSVSKVPLGCIVHIHPTPCESVTAGLTESSQVPQMG